MMEREYKTLVIPCKACGEEFDYLLPFHLYEMTMAAAEEEGEAVEFAGTCPACRADDPFLKLMDSIPGIQTARDFRRRKQ